MITTDYKNAACDCFYSLYRMDRRSLHKASGHSLKKSKENVAKARAKSRAGHQDAQRELEPAVELPHLERLKLWCLERDTKKQRAQQLIKKPFVSAVSRRISTPSKTDKTKQINAVRNSPAPLRNVLKTPAKVVARNRHTENGESTDEVNIPFEKKDSTTMSEIQNVPEQLVRSPVDTLSVADNSSALNTTFEAKNSINKNVMFEANNQSPVDSGIVETDLHSQYIATPKSSLNNGTFELSSRSQSTKRRMTWSKSGPIVDPLFELEVNRSIQCSPLISQNQEAAKYFRCCVDNETRFLEEMVRSWAEFRAGHSHIDAAYLNEIEIAIGQSKLLIDEKLKIFLELCEKCHSETGQQPIRPNDLEKFWSGVFADVEECRSKFQKLERLKDMEWGEVGVSTVALDNSNQTKTKKKNKKTAENAT